MNNTQRKNCIADELCRCRMPLDGVEVCTQITDRRAAIVTAEEHDLTTDGLDRLIDFHLRGLYEVVR